MSKGFQRATESVVFCVISRVLNGVTAADCGGAVGGVGFVGGKIDFAEESGEDS